MKLVLGLGLTGTAVAKFFTRRGEKVAVYDDNEAAFSSLKGEDVSMLQKGDHFDWSSCEQVIVSPGIPPSHPLYQGALDQKIELIGEVELALRHLSHRQIVGITGTNGKSTVTLLAAHLLQSAGKKARSVGNIGTPLIEEVEHVDQKAILSLELSSFQLERVQTKALAGGVILNLTPDHLDRYPTMESYGAAKEEIASILHPHAPLFLNPLLRPLMPRLFERKAELIQGNGREEENEQAAIALVKLFGLSDEEIREGLKTFKKPPHRIELIREREGVAYYNDSKATNLDSTIHALLTLKEDILLIAGGVDKGFSFIPWREIFEGRVKSIFLIGQAAHRIEQELQGIVPAYQCGTLKEALLFAATLAKKGDKVVLSPGCSSYDQFTSYVDRGNTFRSFVESL